MGFLACLMAPERFTGFLALNIAALPPDLREAFTVCSPSPSPSDSDYCSFEVEVENANNNKSSEKSQ